MGRNVCITEANILKSLYTVYPYGGIYVYSIYINSIFMVFHLIVNPKYSSISITN